MKNTNIKLAENKREAAIGLADYFKKSGDIVMYDLYNKLSK